VLMQLLHLSLKYLGEEWAYEPLGSGSNGGVSDARCPTYQAPGAAL